MKTIKFLSYSLFILFLSISISSCSGDDGADGATGPAGINGQDGADGQDGTDGADGNANVQTYVFENPTWGGSSFMELYIDALTQDVISNDAILQYINFGGDTYAIPGIAWNSENGNKEYKVYYDDYNQVQVVSHELDGTYTPADQTATVEWIKVIIIESTNTTTTSGNGARTTSPKQRVYNELKNAGIDINNYNAVCEYYGINPE